MLRLVPRFSGGFFHSGSGSSGTSSNPLGDGRRRTSERIGTGSSPGRVDIRRTRLDAGCATCHIPFPHNSAPFANMRLVPCQSCKKRWVPEVLLATIECPPLLPCHGRGKLVQARACKIMSSSQTKIQKGEALALAVSEILPFLQFELHRQLINKIKIMGMNAAFGVTTQIQLGPNMLVGFVTATAVNLPALPSPPALRIQRNIKVVDAEDRALVTLQDQLQKLSVYNKQTVIEMPAISRLARKTFKSSLSSPKLHNSPRWSAEGNTRLYRSLSATEDRNSFRNTAFDVVEVADKNTDKEGGTRKNIARHLFEEGKDNLNAKAAHAGETGAQNTISKLEIGPPALSVNTNFSSSSSSSSSSSNSNSSSSSSSSSSSDEDRNKDNDDTSDEDNVNKAVSSNRKNQFVFSII